jgi:hypothetical protein
MVVKAAASRRTPEGRRILSVRCVFGKAAGTPCRALQSTFPIPEMKLGWSVTLRERLEPATLCRSAGNWPSPIPRGVRNSDTSAAATSRTADRT